MAIWINKDGLKIKFGAEEAADARGGEISSSDGGLVEFTVDYTDALSATAAILGRAAGGFGVVLSEGVTIEEVELFVTSAFTSSGTIGSATLEIGLVKQSDETTYDADGLTSTALVGSTLDAKGEKNVLRIGSTGVGSAVGTELTENTLVTVRNSAHASHPFTAGQVKVRVRYRMV